MPFFNLSKGSQCFSHRCLFLPATEKPDISMFSDVLKDVFSQLSAHVQTLWVHSRESKSSHHSGDSTVNHRGLKKALSIV